MLNLDVKQELKNVRDLLKSRKLSANKQKASGKDINEYLEFTVTPSGESVNLYLDLYRYKKLLNVFKETKILKTFWFIDPENKNMVVTGGDLEKTKGKYLIKLGEKL